MASCSGRCPGYDSCHRRASCGRSASDLPRLVVHACNYLAPLRQGESGRIADACLLHGGQLADQGRDVLEAIALVAVATLVERQVLVGLEVDGLRQLCADLSVPGPADYGIAEGDWFGSLPTMAEQALASGSPANNPRIPEAGDIIALYERVWAG